MRLRWEQGGPMLIRYGYDITILCPQVTPVVTLLSAHPDHLGDLVRNEEHRLLPQGAIHEYRDGFGNICRRFNAPKGELRMIGEGLIRDSGALEIIRPDARQVAVADLPDETLLYLLPSRYCETDKFGSLVWDLFGKTPPGWARVDAICDFVHHHIAFDYAAARSTRTALEAYQERRGVCRDFAHLAIAFCRCLNIPARYVNGHLGDIGMPYTEAPMDYAAWIEVYLDGAWHMFDPRNNERRIGRIVVARGRDATDVPMITSFGPHVLKSFLVICEEVDASGKAVPLQVSAGAAVA
jgi:transglutaminase-like putative cysteine protease